MRFSFLARCVAGAWIVLVGPALIRGADRPIFRCGDEVMVRVRDLDLLRQSHPRLSASIRLRGSAGEKSFSVDLTDPVVPETIVIDVAGYGVCSGVALDVTNGAGRSVLSQSVSPVPVVKLHSGLPMHAGKWAAIEPGTGLPASGGAEPRIALPDAAKIRSVTLPVPTRSVTAQQITYPVVTDADLPVLASENYVLVSRQTAAPNDPARCSLYFSYKKAVYDPASLRLKKWRKFLVEVPLDRKWLDGADDDVRTLPLSGFSVHATEERAPRGTNMLGENQNGLAQGGQSADIDDKGRIYFSNLNDGAGLVRFNPQTAEFEQPPIDFTQEARRLIPDDRDWKRSWDTDLANLVCVRDRVYILYSRNYRTRTSNGNFETCSGVISIPQDHWNDAVAFRADLRLHAGSWNGAQHRLYDSEPVPADYTRKAGSFVATQHGLFFASPPDCKGGPWRLDLDEKGNTKRLAVVRGLDDPGPAGAPFPRTEPLTVNGLRKQQLINVGSAGRQFLRFNYGEFEMSRAALELTLPGAPERNLADANGRYQTTYPGAPTGGLTIRFDIAAAIAANPERFGELASAASGISLGPNYCVTAIPGEPDQAIAVCEYGYYFSKLDFSRRGRDRKVSKEYLPTLSKGEQTSLPARVGLGPYNATWAEHDGARWLYITGYTGMTRLKYAESGRTLPAFAAEMFHHRLRPQAADGRPRDSVKDFLHVVPAIDGRMIDIGRGRPGRGGGAYSAGLEIFDPRTLGASQTLVKMSRCYGLYSPVSRLVLSASGAAPRQEVYVASGPIRPEYLDDIADPALRPANHDPRIFTYEVTAGGPLRDLFGFSLPPRPDASDSSSSIAFSPCRQFLVVMQKGGGVYTYSVRQKAFIDGVQLRNAAGRNVQPIGFHRPSAEIWPAPGGRIFLQAALDGSSSTGTSYFEIVVAEDGSLTVWPHLAVLWNGFSRASDFDGIVHCFLPDLTRRDGSCDLVLGGNQENGPPSVRVIDDFVPPRAAP